MSALNTVLVVEDDKAMRQMLRDSLEMHDYLVLEASTGSRSLEIIKDHSVDIILLDLHLPDLYGTDLITAMRQKTDVPVMIVSGENNHAKELETFEIGADDYVHKPFDPDMLAARIKAHIRRYNHLLNENTRPANTGDRAARRFGKWTLNPSLFNLVDENNNTAGLTVQEFKILDLLIQNAHRVMKREELSESIRENNYVPTPRAIDIKITRIRKKIGDNPGNPDIIQTVHKIGYRFNPQKILT